MEKRNENPLLATSPKSPFGRFLSAKKCQQDLILYDWLLYDWLYSNTIY
jgi:hypothetical protein